MNNFFLKIPSLETEEYTKYLLYDYIPKGAILHRINNSKYNYFQDYFTSGKPSQMKKIEELLKDKFKIPYNIQYLSIFYHQDNQAIHIDGRKNTVRNSSLNLPLSGYQNTKMIFYKLKIPIQNLETDSDAFYFTQNNTVPVSELEGTNEWVLINTSIPHNVIRPPDSKPRITACIRFTSNPEFEILSKYFDLMNRS